MKDYYLSFTDEAQAKGVLYHTEGAVEANPELGIEADPGQEVANFANIDIIGTIYKPTGERVQTEQGETPVMAPIPGWHVNVRVVDGEDGSVLEAYSVSPTTPMRVWG